MLYSIHDFIAPHICIQVECNAYLTTTMRHILITQSIGIALVVSTEILAKAENMVQRIANNRTRVSPRQGQQRKQNEHNKVIHSN